ncbi:hypothetical protein NIES4103_31290 [Nostoc sp. NIES-4103]|nr:hypothetical protein NIES4103_31290 [Nostoc sp. NIES-4103]
MVREAFRRVKRIDDIYDFFQGVPPQEGLEPLGDSPFHATPSDPADPMDCDRYPDSPYCGGFPFDWRAAGIDIDIVRDECSLGVQLGGSFLFVRLPNFQIVYRSPACQPPPPPPEPNRESNSFNSIPYPQKKCDDGWFLQFATDVSRKGRTDKTVWSGQLIVGSVQWDYESKVTYKLRGATVNYQGNLLIKGKYKPEFYAEIEVTYTRSDIFSLFPNWMYNFYGNPPPNLMPKNSTNEEKGIIKYLVTTDPKASANGYYGKYTEEIFIEGDNPVNARTEAASGVIAFMWHLIAIATKSSYEEYIKQSRYHGCSISPYNNPNSFFYERNCSFYRVEQICDDWKPDIYPPPPPPPPPPKNKKDMGCCSETNQLLRLILKRIGTPQQVTIFDENMEREGAQKANKKPESLNEYFKLTVERIEIANRLIGVENYPVTLPETVIEPYHEGGFLEVFNFIPKNKERKVKTLTELLAWMVEQDSATTGQFHQVFEMEKGDGEKETVVIPNMAEALKETIILNSQMARQMNIVIDAVFRMLTEIVATKVQVCRNVAISQDIQDYLDYPTNNKVEEVKVAINIPKHNEQTLKQIQPDSDEFKNEDYQEFLKEGEAKFTFEDWTGENSFHDQLMDLLQVASMLRAVLYQRVDKDV